jgi:hypothetical protein
MNKIVRALGATLGATAIVGGTAVGANACGPSHQSGGDSHQSSSHVSGYGVRGVHRHFSRFSHSRDFRNADFTVGTSFDHHWYRQHWAGHRHQHLTFAQEQAAIVARLTRADERLTNLITRLSSAASDNPDGWAAKVLPYLKAEQTKLESLIAAVQAATDEQGIADAFKAAFQPTAPAGDSGGGTTAS